jgi:hypothetical protein
MVDQAPQEHRAFAKRDLDRNMGVQSRRPSSSAPTAGNAPSPSTSKSFHSRQIRSRFDTGGDLFRTLFIVKKLRVLPCLLDTSFCISKNHIVQLIRARSFG